MTDYKNTPDVLKNEALEKATLPQGLNVLTILTFIGCSIFGLFSIFTPMILKFSLKMMDKAASSGNELTTKQMEDMEKSRHAIEVSQANMIPLMIIGLIGIALCFWGALMMRKLKKDGFWYYVGGQILPIVGSIAITGLSQFTGVMSYIFMLIPFLFIYLYSRQRKHLVN